MAVGAGGCRISSLLLLAAAGGCGLVLDVTPSALDGALADGGTAADGTALRDHEGDRDAAGSDASAPGTDAGLVLDVILDIPIVGRDGHPTVVWTGDEFVVGLLVPAVEPDTSHVELLRMAPGVVVDRPGERVTSDALARKSLTLAAEGGRLAAGWVDDPGGIPTAAVHLVGEVHPGCTLAPMTTSWDHDDLHLLWDAGSLLAVRRTADERGGETLMAVDLGTSIDCAAFDEDITTMGGFTPLGEMQVGWAAAGPMIVSGDSGLWRRFAGAWNEYGPTWFGTGTPVEADLVEIRPGLVAMLWSTDGELATSTLDFGAGRTSMPGAERTITGWAGPDPSLDRIPSGALAAFVTEYGAGGRTLALAALDTDARVVSGPCVVPNVRPFANDPDVACGGGFCAVVWQEGDTGSTGFGSRILQVRADPAGICP